MTPPATAPPVRERILRTASDLFYRQSYQATGINQIIAESGVAKASFYDHFPAKEDLLAAYVSGVSTKDLADIRAEINKHTDPRKRFFAPIEALEPWLESFAYRGCPFQNIIGEVGANDDRVRTIVKTHTESLRALLRPLAKELLISCQNPAQLNGTQLADIYLILLEGTIATAVACRDPWPVKRAILTLRRLIPEK